MSYHDALRCLEDAHRVEHPEGHESCDMCSSIDRLRACIDQRQLHLHQLITCGVIAEGKEHLNPIYAKGGKWDSPQADAVRRVVAELSLRRAICPECGPVETCDEDRCCLSCGVDLVVVADVHSGEVLEEYIADLRRELGEAQE